MDRNTQYRIEASGITVDVDLGIGHLALFEVQRDGRSSAPFHRAPWADDAEPPAGTEAPLTSPASPATSFARRSRRPTSRPHRRMAGRQTPPGHWSTAAPAGGGITATFVLEKSGDGRARAEGADAARQPSFPLSAPHLRGRHRRAAGRQPRHGQAADRRPHFLFAKALGGNADAPLEGDPQRGRSILAYPARSTDLTISRAPTAGPST